VLVGFKAGIGLVIVLDQVPKLLGIHIHKGSFFHNIWAIIDGLPQASPVTIALAAAVILLLVFLERRMPHAPAPLIAVAAGILAMSLLGLAAYGVESIGEVPTGLPSPVFPTLALVEQLWAPALGIGLMSFTETIAAGRSFARPGEPAPRANQELLATGLSNIAGAFAGAMPAGGGTSQTAVNRAAGARSQLAGLVTAGVTLVTMLVLAPLISMMPQAVLAAVVIVYSIDLIKPAEFSAILRIRRTEFIWALAALAGVVLLGTLQGILVAIIVSLIALAYQVIDPPVHVLGRKPGTNVFRPRTREHPQDEFFPGLLLVRLEGRLFYANAANVQDKVRAIMEVEKPKVFALDLSGVFDIEYTALKVLIDAEERASERGTELWLVGCTPGVLATIRNSSLGAKLGRQRMAFTLEDAVNRYMNPAGRAGFPD
jgi:anti-anti-sigma factor